VVPTLAQQLVAPRAQIEALTGLAAAELQLGDTGRANHWAHRAVQQAGRSGYRVLEGNARATLAGGAGPGSIEQAELALAAHRETGHRAGQAQALAILRQARRATANHIKIGVD
jgi:hypothetical protein